MKYSIAVKWEMRGEIEIEAADETEARNNVLEPELWPPYGKLPQGEYIRDSQELDD